MGYMDQLMNTSKKKKAEKKPERDDNIIFKDKVKLRLYEPTEFVQNGYRKIRMNTKILSGEHEGKYHTFFLPTIIKDNLTITVKMLIRALIQEEVMKAVSEGEEKGLKKSELDDLVVNTFFANSDKIGRATIELTFTEPKEFTRKNGEVGYSQYMKKIYDVTFFTPKEEKQEW